MFNGLEKTQKTVSLETLKPRTREKFCNNYKEDGL